MRRTNPFDDFETLFERMSRQFDEMSRNWDGMGRGWESRMLSEISLDVAEYDDELVVVADLPGYEKSDIDVSVAGDRLTITAERSFEETSESGEYLRRERRQSSVHRSLSLPTEVDEDATKATYSNGVLTITLPKLEVEMDEDSHHIDIN